MADDSGEILKAHITVTADATSAEKAIDQVQKDFQEAVPKVEASSSKIKDALKSIKAEGGRGSSIGQLGQLLRGAGAVAGITILTRELAAATGKAADLATQLRLGKISGGEFAEQMAASVPILGQAWQAGRNIREIITGENAELEKQIALLDAIARANNAVADANEERLKGDKARTIDNQRTLDEANSANLRTSGNSTGASVSDLNARFNEEYRAKKKALDDEYKKEIGLAENAKRIGEQTGDQNAIMGATKLLQSLPQKQREEQAKLLESLSALYDAKYNEIINKELNELNFKASQAGRNPLDQAYAQEQRSGLKGYGDATGRLLGAELKEEVRTPFEKFSETMDYYKTLLNKHFIDNNTFILAQKKAFEELVAGSKSGDIDTFARENIHRNAVFQTSIMAARSSGILPSVEDIQKQNEINRKAEAERKAEEHAKAVKDNTAAVSMLTDTMKGLSLNQTQPTGATYG